MEPFFLSSSSTTAVFPSSVAFSIAAVTSALVWGKGVVQIGQIGFALKKAWSVLTSKSAPHVGQVIVAVMSILLGMKRSFGYRQSSTGGKLFECVEALLPEYEEAR